MHINTMAGSLEIVIVEVGADYLVGTMPINSKSVQPFRNMHGGASAAMAETLGSVAAQMVVNPQNQRCVGLSLNVSHIRAVPEGHKVTGTARPFHLGRSTHVWDIQIKDHRAKLVTVSRLTMSVLAIPSNA
ncbi:MAG: hotdog fold thioesterase [Chloroflexota bacterium]